MGHRLRCHRGGVLPLYLLSNVRCNSWDRPTADRQQSDADPNRYDSRAGRHCPADSDANANTAPDSHSDAKTKTHSDAEPLSERGQRQSLVL